MKLITDFGPFVVEPDGIVPDCIVLASTGQDSGYAAEIRREEGLTEDDWRLAHLLAAAPEMLAALKEAETVINSLDRSGYSQSDVLAIIRGGISKAEGRIDAPQLDPYESAARAAGWTHGGDGDGFIYDSNVFGSWKEAASWAGDEDCGDEDMATSATYATWRECCEGEGIEVGG